MIGQTISHYKILEKLGAGGMGVVYKAQDTKLDRFVALKFLPQYLNQAEEEKQRFIHEAKAASALNHPNIATIYEIDEADGQMFIAMEYIEGQSLQEMINIPLNAPSKGNLKESPLEGGAASAAGGVIRPLPLDKAIDYATQIAAGLQATHEKGIIHRDIKPANILLTEDGVVKIVDFGLAKSAGQSMLTKEGTTLGTVAYMSPEQAQGVDVDHRADIWALGAVLFEMISGNRPFAGDFDQAVIYAIMNEDQAPLSGLRASVPMDVERLVNKCLAKKPEERYQRLDELMVDLRALQKTRHLSDVGVRTPARVRFGLRSLLAEKSFLLAALALLGLLTALALLLLKHVDTSSADTKSVAVLPFDNLSDTDDDYFSDGMTEDILAQLSKIRDITVISSIATKRYKGSAKRPRDIAHELNVATLLTGKVRQSGGKLRISCQLIDAVSESQIWAETYDRDMKDVFAIQSDVAHQIAVTLQAQLSPEERQRIQSEPTADLTAYDYYLKGREYYYRETTESNEFAIDLFKKALVRDANLGLAWAGLCDAYYQKSARFGFEFSWVDSAIVAGDEAVRVAHSSAEAFAALGTAYHHKGEHLRALEVLQKAVELNPNYFPAITRMANIYFRIGKLPEAVHWGKKAVVVNPTWVFAYEKLGQIYRLLDDQTNTELTFKKGLELQPDYAELYYEIALLYLAQDKDELARAEAHKILQEAPQNAHLLAHAGDLAHYSGDFPFAKESYQKSQSLQPSIEKYPYNIRAVRLGHIYWKEGQETAAHRLFENSLQVLQKQINTGDVSVYGLNYYLIAAIHATLGDKTKAYSGLQNAVDTGWRDFRLALRDPLLENLREDVEFKLLLAQLRAMVDEMRTHAAKPS